VVRFSDEALEIRARIRNRVGPRDADRAKAVLACDRAQPVFQKSRFA
jgi:hypothetical protein